MVTPLHSQILVKVCSIPEEVTIFNIDIIISEIIFFTGPGREQERLPEEVLGDGRGAGAVRRPGREGPDRLVQPQARHGRGGRLGTCFFCW